MVANSGTTSTSATLCMVLSIVYSGGTSLNQLFATDGNWVLGNFHILIAGSSRTVQCSVNVNAGNDWTTPYSYTDGQIFKMIFDFTCSTGVGTAQFNGGTINTHTYASISNINIPSFDIGSWSGDNTRVLNGKIYEIFIYNRTLTTTERTNLNAYLYSLWGV